MTEAARDLPRPSAPPDDALTSLSPACPDEMLADASSVAVDALPLAVDGLPLLVDPLATVDVLDALPVAVVVLSRTGEVQRANRLAMAWGAVRDARLTSPRVRRLVRAAVVGGGPATEDLHLAAMTGQEWRRPVRARLVATGGGWVLSLEDRTAAEDVATVRRDFMAGLAHELKTPVGALLLLSEAALAATDDADTRERLVRRLQGEASRLADLVRDVLQLARVQGSEDVGELDLRDAVQLVGSAVASVRAHAGELGVAIHVSGPERVLLRAHGDQLADAVRRLLDNALAFSRPGQQVDVELRRHDGVLDIRVNDRGPGVPAPARERVFERFFRVDAARSRRTGGSGVGLAVVKHVAERHGGSAFVRARPGGGASFVLRLPVEG